MYIIQTYAKYWNKHAAWKIKRPIISELKFQEIKCCIFGKQNIMVNVGSLRAYVKVK